MSWPDRDPPIPPPGVAPPRSPDAPFHLVFTTLHTRDAKGAITRFADLFPQDVQREVRTLLALSLRAVISQRLLPDVQPGKKRHLALSILLQREHLPVWQSSTLTRASTMRLCHSILNPCELILDLLTP